MRQLASLDGVRAVACLWVLTFHCLWYPMSVLKEQGVSHCHDFSLEEWTSAVILIVYSANVWSDFRNFWGCECRGDGGRCRARSAGNFGMGIAAFDSAESITSDCALSCWFIGHLYVISDVLEGTSYFSLLCCLLLVADEMLLFFFFSSSSLLLLMLLFFLLIMLLLLLLFSLIGSSQRLQCSTTVC